MPSRLIDSFLFNGLNNDKSTPGGTTFTFVDSA